MLTRLHKLPRDARDTLFLLLVIGTVLAPQLGHLPLWCSMLALGVLGWRGWLAWSARPLPSRWWLFGLLVLTIGATLWTHRTILGRDAGVTMIVVLLTLKTLELRARRDAFVVFFLGFFTMLTNFFFSQSLLTAAAMLVALMGLLTALVNTHMPVGKPPLREAARIAALMALMGAPIMAILFMLFPRLAPLWGIPSDAMAGRSGLSASMQVGSVASLALEDSVAMRIRFDGAPPRQNELYFRGPVLSTLDGREWRALRSRFPASMQDSANLQVSGTGVQYQVTLEPNNRNWILALDATPDKPAAPGRDLRMTPELQWVSAQPVSELLRYQVRSFPQYRQGPLRRTAALQDYLELPPGFNPRTLQWASELRQGPRAELDPARLIETVLARLRSGGYGYTLDPGVYGQHTADEFWFDRKEGFCEHIASSFVILMRSLDIPARVVTGYQGGEFNGVGGFWVVRQSDAHAWAEVWLEGRGWIRVDPTSAVAPARTGSLQRLQAPRGLIATALEGVSPAALFNLRAAWDAVNNGWNQWVLNYSQTTQLKLLQDIGFTSPDWADLGYVLIALVVAASLLGAAWTLWDRTRQDPWLRLLRRANRRIGGAGLPLPPNTPPRSMATLVEKSWGKDAPAARAITGWLLRLEAVRYAPGKGSTQFAIRALKREFKHLPWPSS
jgi:transglutaminase-like putative cysteine protease